MVVHPLESSGRHSRSVHARMRGALPSIAVHAAIILVAVHATAHAALPHDAPHPPPIIHYVPTDPPRVEPTTPVRSTPEKGSPVIDAGLPLVPPLVIPDHITPVSVDRGAPVVDSTDFGRGVTPSLSTDSELFSAAVRSAVLRTRFHPAEAGGRRVRQLVQESFSFVLQ